MFAKPNKLTIPKRLLRVRAENNSQILSVEAPAGQGAKALEYNVLLNADTRRASDALHSTMKVKNFYSLAVNVVCIEHGI